jgi:Uma2 family endonuclease
MATTVEPRTRALEPEQRFVLHGVGWQGYEAMLGIVGDRLPRITYRGGDMELMSPSQDHERFKVLLRRIVDVVTEEFRIPCRATGATTWRRKAKDCGLEADESYYVANFPLIRGKKIDQDADPAPDLAIDVEISRSALNRTGIYAALGVSEVWRFDGATLRVGRLQADGSYSQVAASVILPILPLDEVVRWVRLDETVEDQTSWSRRSRGWVREMLAPRG